MTKIHLSKKSIQQIKHKLDEDDINQIRWNLNSVNIPRTRRLSNFFLMSKKENEETQPAEEEAEQINREQWQFSH